MSASTIPTRDLTGKRFGWWYVVGFAGQRDEINYWQCLCCWHGIQRIFPEPDLLNRKGELSKHLTAFSSSSGSRGDFLDRKGELSNHSCRCMEPNGALTGCIFGLWTVVELTHQGEAKSSEEGTVSSWRCRCMCGTERDLKEEELTSLRTLSCGCRSHKVLRAEFRSWQKRASRSLLEAKKEAARRWGDRKWTAEMERALCNSQPACVICGAVADLTTDHVEPQCKGHCLAPGNAVRLCRFCNSSKNYLDLNELPPEMAQRLRSAAAQFKEFWASKCRTSVISPAPTSHEIGAVVGVPEKAKEKDSALTALLRAVEWGDDTAISALADWLEERSDPRARAIRELATLEVVVRETRTIANEERHWVEVVLNGKISDFYPIPWDHAWIFLGNTKEAVEQRVREMRKRRRSAEVWRRLGLSEIQRNALKQYLGINSTGIAASIEEIAEREGKRVQTIKSRIDLAMHRMAVPAPQVRYQR